MNVFIDTNILLKFYHYTSDELKALEAVFVSQRRGKVNLCITSQVVDEFIRNREGKLDNALRKFKEIKIATELPSFMQEFDEFKEVIDLSKELKKKLNVLLDSSNKLIEESNLDADILIRKIFERSDIMAIDADILEAAKNRVERGNPPGKKGALGDAINWELMLRNVPDSEELYVISEDGDFYSTLYKSKISEFLQNEWKRVKDSSVTAYKQLSPFMKEHSAGKYLSFDKKKMATLLSLSESASFSRTHALIEQLAKYKKYSLNEVKILFSAAFENSQVGGIVTDYDVCDLLLHASAQHKDDLDSECKKLIVKLEQSVEERG